MAPCVAMSVKTPGEAGRLFDEIQDLVEPAERRAKEGGAGLQRGTDAEALRSKA